jgi:ubiquinone/menaquinone biosynthesis C-methylase UbiE
MSNQPAKIKEFWNNQAEKYKIDYLATTPDKFVKDLEIKNILKYIPEKCDKIVDLGCGNGFSTIEFAKERNSDFTGIDYAENMIGQAQKALQKNKRRLKGKINFMIGDILDLSFLPANKFDAVITDRCLINLVSLSDQKKAIGQIEKILKKKGKYIMCEDTQEGLNRINELRKLSGLSIIPNHWHNVYLNEKSIIPYIKRYFNILEIDNFSSLYYIASRIFNAISAKDTSKPDYLSEINRVASILPSVGDFSPLKIFYLEKK